MNWPNAKTQRQPNAPNGWNADASTFDVSSVLTYIIINISLSLIGPYFILFNYCKLRR